MTVFERNREKLKMESILPNELKPLMFPKGGPIVKRSATRKGDAFWFDMTDKAVAKRRLRMLFE